MDAGKGKLLLRPHAICRIVPLQSRFYRAAPIAMVEPAGESATRSPAATRAR
jgi:hypothetical protein